MKWVQLGWWLAFATAPLLACKAETREPPECAQSRQKARELMRIQRLGEAKQALAVAQRTCHKASSWDVQRLQGLLLLQEKQQLSQTEQLKKEASIDEKEPLRPFLRWARSVVATNKERVGKVSCAPRGTPEFGFCSAAVEQPSGAPFRIRYLANNSEAFRLEWELAAPVGCFDLGAHRAGPQKKTPTGSDLFLCELTDHAFTGMTALLEVEARRSRVLLYVERYLEADPELRKLVERDP